MQNRGDLNQGDVNNKFLSAIDEKSKQEILNRIAAHYGISSDQAFEEVTDEEAEHLLDYMIEPHRTATYVLMQRHELNVFNQMSQDCADESAFGIFHKTKKEWFLGFDESNLPMFGDQKRALRFGDKISARTQALFLVNLDRGVQKTPKNL